jgi:hypothetical protein
MAREDHDNPTSRLAAELQAEVAAGASSPAPWPAGCIKPGSCGRHAQCVYGRAPERCRHHGRDLTADVAAAAREREWAAADPRAKVMPAEPVELVPLDLLRRYMQRVADHEGVTFAPYGVGDTRTIGGAPTASFTASEVSLLHALILELGREP